MMSSTHPINMSSIRLKVVKIEQIKVGRFSPLLYQIANMQPSEISKTLGKCKAFVFKYYKRDLSDPTNFYDLPPKGVQSQLSPQKICSNSLIAICEGKLNQSVIVLRDKLEFSTGSVSNDFKKLGLFAYRRGVQSRLKKKHIRVRFKD